MANRRMFSKTVISSARFLRMPASSRLLYYDLGMEADDDGVVEAFTVMRTTGACDDDLRVLVARGFVRVLTDDLVTVICDWNINNQLRKDRYTPSLYKPLLLGLEAGTQMETVWQPNGNQMEPQYSIGKDRIDQVSVEESADNPPTRHKFVRPAVEDVKAYCTEKSLAVDAERFVDFYEANGWRVGRNPMKDWKAAARNWARRDGGGDRQEPPRQADIDWSMIDYIPEEVSG